jgi:hypothetical protein
MPRIPNLGHEVYSVRLSFCILYDTLNDPISDPKSTSPKTPKRAGSQYLSYRDSDGIHPVRYIK